MFLGLWERGSLLGDDLCHLREFVVMLFSFLLGGFLGAGTGPRGGREASRGNLAAAVPRHSLDRLNTSNDSLKKKKSMQRLIGGCCQ